MGKKESWGLERVGKVSRWMQALLCLGMVLVLLWPPFVWLGEIPAWFKGEFLEKEIPVTLTLATRCGGFLLTLMIALIVLLVMNEARRLFASYARGQIFTLAAACHLRRMGLWLVVLGLGMPFFRTLVALMLTLANPPGQRYLILTVLFGDYLIVMVGGLLSVMAWVMAEAARMAEENAGFV